MATVQEVMLIALNKAARASEQITPSLERAKAFTELAKACAMAIQTKAVKDISSIELSDVEMPKEVQKAKRNTKRVVEEKTEPAALPESEEQKPVEEKPVEPEPIAKDFEQQIAPYQEKVSETEVQKQEKAPEEIEAEEYDFTNEWTPKAMELLDPQIKEIERYAEMFSDDISVFNAMVTAATHGASVNMDSITPLNIRIVLQYIQNLEKESKERNGN